MSNNLPQDGVAVGPTTTGTYDQQFEQIMIDNCVYPIWYCVTDGVSSPEPQNLKRIRQRLSRRRESLSLSGFPEEAFKNFGFDNHRAATDLCVMVKVVPTIQGNRDRQHETAANKQFTTLKKFHSNLTVPQPDWYYGSRPAQVDPRVRQDLSQYIVPASRVPIAPNYFLEVKGPTGRGDVLLRQALYCGAVGARGMFHLQNYGTETQTYDGNAYSITATYDPSTGVLQLFATHPCKLATGQTGYHMTTLETYPMTVSREHFSRGAAAYRNARDLSKEQRDRFIAEANATAQRLHQ